MNKRNRKPLLPVLLPIFIIAVISVIVVVFIIYQNGFRYIKSEAGIKFFGSSDNKTSNILDGRLWYESDAAKISLQKYYIFEAIDESIASYLPDQEIYMVYRDFLDINNSHIDIFEQINIALSDGFTPYFPMGSILFNRTDERVMFRETTFEVIIKDYENIGNNIKSGDFYTTDGVGWIQWTLIPNNTSPKSYKDYDVVQSENRARKYRGDVLDFIKYESVFYASVELVGGNIIKLYPVNDNIYRVSYDKGGLADDLYIGEINGDYEKHGTGIYFYKSGDIYFGNFLNGDNTGSGMFLWSTGDSYSGQMENGRRNGEGVLKWSDGESYTGIFTDNMKNGYGVNIFSDGSVYEGDYSNNIKHGKGKYSWVGGDVYEGDFVNDLYRGDGRYTWASGEYYEGDFMHNTLHGWGMYHWISGRTYEGWFLYGEMVLEKPEDVTHRDEHGALLTGEIEEIEELIDLD